MSHSAKHDISIIAPLGLFCPGNSALFSDISANPLPRKHFQQTKFQGACGVVEMTKFDKVRQRMPISRPDKWRPWRDKRRQKQENRRKKIPPLQCKDGVVIETPAGVWAGDAIPGVVVNPASQSYLGRPSREYPAIGSAALPPAGEEARPKPPSATKGDDLSAIQSPANPARRGLPVGRYVDAVGSPGNIAPPYRRERWSRGVVSRRKHHAREASGGRFGPIRRAGPSPAIGHSVIARGPSSVVLACLRRRVRFPTGMATRPLSGKPGMTFRLAVPGRRQRERIGSLGRDHPDRKEGYTNGDGLSSGYLCPHRSMAQPLVRILQE